MNTLAALVLDFDETLIFHSPLTLRPYVIQFLKEISHFFKPVIIFSHGTETYVYESIIKLSLEPYIDAIYSRSDCQKSLRKFKVLKSWYHIIDKLPTHRKFPAILIDDIPANGADNSYLRIYEILPFKGDVNDTELLKLFQIICIDFSIPSTFQNLLA